MSTIDHFNLRAFDLNLLVAFDAIMEEANVTRAAQRLKIQQPAMSHNLSTLRMLFQDDLFVRVGQEMQPTSKARALAGPIRNVLRQAQSALSAAELFDPATEERVFRIGMKADVELLLLPDLISRLRRCAPGIRILARGCHPDDLDRMLTSGVLDMAIGCSYGPTPRQIYEVLYAADVMCCYNPDFLSLSNPVLLDDYLAADHVVISQSESLHGCVKDALHVAGAELNIVAAGPDFMSVLSAAKVSPVIATIPARIADKYAPMLGLQVSPVPLDLRFPPVAMTWAAHADNDPASVWLRKQIRSILDPSSAHDAGPEQVAAE